MFSLEIVRCGGNVVGCNNMSSKLLMECDEVCVIAMYGAVLNVGAKAGAIRQRGEMRGDHDWRDGRLASANLPWLGWRKWKRASCGSRFDDLGLLLDKEGLRR